MRLKILLIAALGSLSACSQASSDTRSETPVAAGETLPLEARHPISGLEVVIVKVKTGKRTYGFETEMARTRAEQAKGLMFRTQMGPYEAMLFPLNPPRQASFWMRNTVIPLDIIFIGADRTILNIEADAVPYSEDQRRSHGEAAAVLELAGGRAAELGIGPGDRVEW